MLDIAWKTVRSRIGAFVGAFVALVCATALLSASGILAESGLRTSAQPHRYAAADAVVGGKQTLELRGADFTVSERLPEQVRLPADMVTRIGALNEVERAVADRHIPIAVAAGTEPPVSVLGHSWDTAVLGDFRVAAGRPVERPGEVVVTAGLAGALEVRSGDTIQLIHAAEPAAFRVAGIAANAAAGNERAGSIFLHADDVRRLDAPAGSVTAVGVIAAPGVDRAELKSALEHAAGDTAVTIYSGRDIGGIEYADVGVARGLLLMISGSFGGLAVVIALFVVSATLTLSINTRRREFAVLRAIGSTPAQILRMVGAEALLLSLVAGVVGVLPGILVARAMHGAFASTGAFPPNLPLTVGPVPLIAAVLLTTGTALAGGMAAALGPAWTNPVEAMRESTTPPRAPAKWRGPVGMIVGVLGIAAAMTPLTLRSDAGAAATGSAALLLVISVALLGPVLLRPLVALLSRPLRRIWVTGFLAAETSTADLRRVGAVLTPLVLAVGFTLAMIFTQSVVSSAVSGQVDRSLVADAVVTDTGSGGIGSAPVEEIAALPETGEVVPVRRTEIFVPYSVFGDPDVESLTARGVGAGAAHLVLDPDVLDGDVRQLSGNTVALERSAALLLRRTIGDMVDLRLGDGTPVSVKLVATYDRGLGLGSALLPNEVLDGHAQAPSLMLVTAAPGTSPAQLTAALHTLTDRYPSLQVADRGAFADGARSEAELAAWVNLIGLGVIMAYVAIAVANSLVMATLARSREFAVLRLIGMTRGQVLRSLRLEVLLVVLLGILLGTLAALVPLAVLSWAFLGTPVPAGSPWAYAGVVVAAALLGFGSVLPAAHKALCTPPVEAIGVRE
ncbi:MAG: ABC transporter permease [Micrococcales bacterium]|nr:MAG: ABC transporter permease [Micrococcales bacterium]PIE27434.1 MAG: ABC transporter permease [Micrococcales bacterium]